VDSVEDKVLVVTVVIGLLLGLGCRQEATPDTRQARLIAAESMQLKKQLAARDEEMKQLKVRHAKEIEQRQAQLEACRTRIEVLQEDLEGDIAKRVDSVMTAVMQENARLRKEIESLRAEISALRAQPPSQP